MNPWATNTVTYKQPHCEDDQRRYVSSGECEIEGGKRRGIAERDQEVVL